MENEVIKYQVEDKVVELSPDIVKKYLVSGDGKITDQEIMMFLKLCEYQELNPFLREVYLVKYGSKPATMITGKETFLKRAYRHPKYQGHKTGISTDGKTAWAEVYVENYQTPIRCEVDYDEYVGKKSDGSVNRMWTEKPRTMLKKVALVQALREAFPETFGGMYSQEEINTIDATELSTKVVNPEGNGVEYISEEQVAELIDTASKRIVNSKKFLAHFKVESLQEIPAKRWNEALQAIRACPERPKEREPGEDDDSWMDGQGELV